MVEEEGKKEEKVEFDSAGEAVGYISLDQARVLTIEHARDNTETNGRRYAGLRLVWEVVRAEVSEHFIVDKTGQIKIRQILTEPCREEDITLTSRDCRLKAAEKFSESNSRPLFPRLWFPCDGDGIMGF